ncbi:uncharacterized protein LOC122524142 [Polistes fuscatus]|uniref:uncharacterized protein LOC122524142 n=1 Tax=Polistes fuscatus TaxID=30207 RepID=UPI001CA92F28|nr:uncharacterized protein LOC122524142 [Polistes fuscatus]
MSFDSKRELIRTPSADTNRSSSEFELSEVLRSYPDLDSKLIRCKCYVVTNNKCQCRYRYQCCHCQRRRISSISRRESFGSLRRKDSSYSVSTCQSFLPPSSVRNSSIGSVYRIGYYNRGDSSSDQNERIVNKELPIQRRYSDQTHFVRPCQIEYADRRRYSEQTPRDNIVECSSASRCNNHLRSRLSSRFLAKAGQKRSSLSFKPTTSYDDVPVKEEEEEEGKEKEKEHDETDYEKDGNDSGISSVPDNRRKSKATTSAPTVNPKMFKRRFSEQLILEGGLSGLPDFDTLVRPEQDDIAEDDEESLTGINARKRLTLKKHYYPEGGWGRTIILVGVLVQLLSHGLQLAAGVILTPMINHFKRDVRDAGIDVTFNGKHPADPNLPRIVTPTIDCVRPFENNFQNQ